MAAKAHAPAFSAPLYFTIFCWAANYSALKLLYQHVTAPAVALTRSLIVGVFMVAVMHVRKEKLHYPPGQTLRILWHGFLSLGVYMVLFLEGMRTASPNAGSVVLLTAPVLAIFLSILLKLERFSWQLTLGSALAFGGAATVVLTGAHKGLGDTQGPIYVFGAAIVWAIAVVIAKPLLATLSPLQLFTLSLPGAMFALVPYGLLATIHTNWGALGFIDWLCYAHVSLFSGGLAFVTFYIGMQQLGASRAAMTQFVVPPVAMIFAFFLLHQALIPIQVVGMAVAVLGVYLAVRRRPEAELAAEEPA